MYQNETIEIVSDRCRSEERAMEEAEKIIGRISGVELMKKAVDLTIDTLNVASTITVPTAKLPNPEVWTTVTF